MACKHVLWVCVCACARVCACACVRLCAVRALRVRARVCVCVCVCAFVCVRACLHMHMGTCYMELSDDMLNSFCSDWRQCTLIRWHFSKWLPDVPAWPRARPNEPAVVTLFSHK